MVNVVNDTTSRRFITRLCCTWKTKQFQTLKGPMCYAKQQAISHLQAPRVSVPALWWIICVSLRRQVRGNAPTWIEDLRSFALCSAGPMNIFLYPRNDFIAMKLYEKQQFLIFYQQSEYYRCSSIGDSELSQLHVDCALFLLRSLPVNIISVFSARTILHWEVFTIIFPWNNFQ